VEKASASDQPIGVSGWLLFLCLVLVVFIPIGISMELFTVWRRARLTYEREILDLVIAAVDLAMLGLAVAAGVMLYRLRRLGVLLAEIFFAVRLFIAIFAAVENRTAEAGLAILVSSAWLIYLVTSRRVRRTYPSKTARISEIFR
jgi:hypothetical protein